MNKNKTNINGKITIYEKNFLEKIINKGFNHIPFYIVQVKIKKQGVITTYGKLLYKNKEGGSNEENWR